MVLKCAKDEEAGTRLIEYGHCRLVTRLTEEMAHPNVSHVTCTGLNGHNLTYISATAPKFPSFDSLRSKLQDETNDCIEGFEFCNVRSDAKHFGVPFFLSAACLYGSVRHTGCPIPSVPGRDTPQSMQTAHVQRPRQE